MGMTVHQIRERLNDCGDGLEVRIDGREVLSLQVEGQAEHKIVNVITGEPAPGPIDGLPPEIQEITPLPDHMLTITPEEETAIRAGEAEAEEYARASHDDLPPTDDLPLDDGDVPVDDAPPADDDSPK